METNYTDLIERVTLLFHPAKFTLVLTTSNDLETMSLHTTAIKQANGYQWCDEFRFKLDCDYTVTFQNYTKI